MKNPIKVLAPNTRGRDFVFGDLHGSLSVFMKLLSDLNFDPAVDRAITVGDLVDRGPDSLGCLRLLREPWFHAVLANHEQMMLAAFKGEHIGEYWLPNGGVWGAAALRDHNELAVARRNNSAFTGKLSADSAELFDLLALAQDLPFLITIERPTGEKFHVLHAEMPPAAGITDDDLSSPDRVIELATTDDGQNGECFLWSRFIFGQFYGQNLTADVNKIKRTIDLKFKGGSGPFNDGLSHIISGHTILQHPLTIFGQTAIDTCAYGSYGGNSWCALTVVDLATWKFYQGTRTAFREVTPITINRDTINQRGTP